MYLVSACLAGCPCRYDGKDNAIKEIIDLVNSGKAIPVCPEQLGGLTTPRVPAEIRDSNNEGRKVFTKEGVDVTGEFILGAERTLAITKALGVRKAILKAKSPSCGVGEIYDGSYTKTLIEGDGITATYLIESGIKVFTENDLAKIF